MIILVHSPIWIRLVKKLALHSFGLAPDRMPISAATADSNCLASIALKRAASNFSNSCLQCGGITVSG